MPESTFINPVGFLPPQNEAERKFVKCMAEGKPCIIGESIPAKSINEDKHANVIRAELISFFAWGGDGNAPIRGNMLTLRGAYVHGRLNLEQVISNYALILPNCYFEKSIWMLHSKFQFVNLSGSYLSGGFLGAGMRVDKDMLMGGGLVARDTVNLVGGDIGGSIFCQGSKFKNEGGCALLADRLKVGENVSMADEFYAEGSVRLLGANIGGELVFNNGKFINKGRKAIAADGIRVNGDVLMCNNFFAEGEVGFPAASIGGSFCCDNGHFKDKEVALCASGIKVERNLFMRGKFSASGIVLLSSAYVSRDCVCFGVFNNGLNAESAQIKNGLFWCPAGGRGEVNLGYSTAKILIDDKTHLDNFNFVLHGFSYDKFANPWDIQSRLKWLTKRPERHLFSPQPFEQAARVLSAMGKSGDARDVLFAMEKRITEEMAKPAAEEKNISRWNKVKRWIVEKLRRFWGMTTGYNYRLRRMLGTSAAIILFGVAVFWAANYAGYVVPHQPVVLKMAQESKHVKDGGKCANKKRPTDVVECLLPNYPRFNALSFSADVFIPIFALHQEPYWYPQPDADVNIIWRVILPGWYWIQIIAGWVLTSVFALTITGILQRRQSQAESK